MHCEVGIGARANLARQSFLSTYRTAPLSRYLIRKCPIQTSQARTRLRSSSPCQLVVPKQEQMDISEAPEAEGARAGARKTSWLR